MNAIIWKKYINVRKNKARLYLFLAFPIIYFVLLNLLHIDIEVIVAYFAFTTTLCSNLFHWNVEDLIYSEVLLVSDISIKKYWRINYLFITLTGYIYSYIVLIVGCSALALFTDIQVRITSGAFVQSICLVCAAMAVIAMGSVHYSDFSRVKQLYTSLFSILPLLMPVVLVGFSKYFAVNYLIIAISIGISIVLLLAAEMIVRCTKNENLVLNLQKLVTGYTANIINE